MKRKDLKVGDKFRYCTSPVLYQVVTNQYDLVSPGFYASHSPGEQLEEAEVIPIPDGVVAKAKPDPKDDLTKSPHYTKLSPEPIAVIEAWDLGFRLANVIKYVARAGRKPGADKKDDLIKARNYLTREINAIDGVSSWENR